MISLPAIDFYTTVKNQGKQGGGTNLVGKNSLQGKSGNLENW